jgi:TPR repeat protein
MHHLGICFLMGRGVEQSEGQAISCLEAAMKKGHSASAVALAQVLTTKVPARAAEGAEILKKAAAAGDVVYEKVGSPSLLSLSCSAQACLATAYFEGKGVPQDDTLAAQWYLRAEPAIRAGKGGGYSREVLVNLARLCVGRRTPSPSLTCNFAPQLLCRTWRPRI